jgi:hypothetical protein
MKNLFLMVVACAMLSFAGMAQTDTSAKAPADTSLKPAAPDSVSKPVPDTVVKVVTAPANCYQEWFEFMRSRGANAPTDGTHEVVVAFKTPETCICFMGKIDVVGGKMKGPLYIQSEDGNYKAVQDLGKKLEPEFVTSMGADLMNVTDGMSALFRTQSQEYGRVFFYKLAKKGGNSNKIAPSPSELIKD